MRISLDSRNITKEMIENCNEYNGKTKKSILDSYPRMSKLIYSTKVK